MINVKKTIVTVIKEEVGVNVDSEGIILKTLFKNKFYDYVKEDMYIEVKNLSFPNI